MRLRSGFGLVAVGVLMATVTACGDDDPAATAAGPEDGMRIASFDFAESELLAEMYAQVVESTGTPVVRLGPVGPREIVAPATQQDLIDLVPEYLGTGLQFSGAMETNPDTQSALSDFNDVLEPLGLVALDAAPAEDKNVFAVNAERAQQEGWEAISDLHQLRGEGRFGGPPECQDRALCLVGLREVYALQFAEFVPQPSLVFTAEALRRDEIDVGLMFSTAAELVAFDLAVLEDDRGLQPAENIVPIMRRDALDRWGPEVADSLNAMSAELTTRELRILNVEVGNGEPVEVVAGRWLTERDLVG
ncbi:MAG: ABC transporter substrate-binding protein [Ilumatobacter sp.]|uniref:ABC transporter substrate-binding protein n=1 Tax=Ilumatobacter sp. TaxID=1967498 RepID=UPI002637835E|nr:ABC transporter substrate-binding protein [Ilumatobacter sp.]MDJ0770571.1 ABC transporter substrate-binding protein [Ilumatobacter sp.]